MKEESTLRFEESGQGQIADLRPARPEDRMPAGKSLFASFSSEKEDACFLPLR
jgi:hypothetical protein